MDAVASETITFLLEKLFETATEEYNLVHDFKKDSINLKKYLRSVNGFLEDAKRREIEDEAVKSWLKDLEDAVYDADVVLDEINYEYLRRQIESRDDETIKPKRWYSNIPCCSRAANTTLTFKHNMAHKIKGINANFKRINDGANSLGLLRVKDYPLAKRPVIDETTSILVDPVFVGRHNDEKIILEKIMSSTCNDVVSVIPIVGMGGIGKTTLARKIFNHNDTQNHFNEKMWICVSENFDQLTLFKKMLELLKGDFHGDNKEVIVRKLQEKLNGKRYLLVLDDLWNREKKIWDEFINTMMGVNFNKGNVIIVTTRSTEVASIVNPFEDPYNLGKLSNEDCWTVIKAKAFRGGDAPMQFESIGKDIAHKCGGLPLLANMIGGVLTRKGIDVWQSILQTELSNLQVGDNGVTQVIKVSYDRLPNSIVKKCFAYCSLFIKDSVINKDDLIQLWMAEGFLGNDFRSDMESTGNNIFNMLLHNSFFQEVVEDEYGNIVKCKMHDLVHDFASLISNSENLIYMEGPTINDIPWVRRLVAHSIGQDKERDIKEKASHVRTLILESGVPHEILPFFKRLYVLKLCDAGIEELSDSIGKLIHLRYLDVSENDGLKTLPDSICKLFNLQTLRILGNELERLPKDLRFLIHLRHLCFDEVDDAFEMPPQIGRLSCLETLTLFCVSNKEGCRIDELGRLKNLKGKLKLKNLELVSNKIEAEKADIAGKRGIYQLHFHWRECQDADATEISIKDESILEALQPHENLKRLRIEGFRGENFPLWTRNMEICKGIGGNIVMFDKLIKIKFKNCSQVKEIPKLGHLPHLQFLTLNSLPEVTSIGLSFYGVSDCNNDGQETTISFPSLVSLKIEDMDSLTEWTEPQNNSRVQILPNLDFFRLDGCRMLSHVPLLRAVGGSLRYLGIEYCDQLMELNDDLNSLESLETLEIGNCENLQLIRPPQNGQKGLSSLERLTVYSCENLISLPEMNGMGSLQCLEVEDCENLISLPEMSGMGSLQRLEVKDCENLISLPEMSGMGSLQHLEVSSCGNLTSLPELCGMGSLQTLQVEDCENLISLPKLNGIGSLRHLYVSSCGNLTSLPELSGMRSLQSLQVTDCANLTSFPEMSGMGSLQDLDVSNCTNLISLPGLSKMECINRLRDCRIGKFSESMQFSSFEGFIGDIKHMKSLQRLELYGLDDWVSLPHQIQHLTSLKFLLISGFGIKALPDWLGNLSSLETLEIEDCKKLKHLPSKEAMLRLTKLRRITISDCPPLKERCKEDSCPNSEWSKISHISEKRGFST